MAYTEKVSLSGTALSFLIYECMNSECSQEGFLIGDVTSQITNHISDSHNDNARLDIQIAIRTVLPLPSVSLFYLPSGKIREGVLTELLSNSANKIIGWYKYRKNSSIKPTFRDKLISKGLQKYFEKFHGKKTFVSCNLSNKISSAGSTHTIVYKFGKINCFDMYENVEEVTANLGEKLTGYRKAHRPSPYCMFNTIVQECKVDSNNTNDAILLIQQAVDIRLSSEAKIAAKSECAIRELEAEVKQMSSILAEKQIADLESAYNKTLEDKHVNEEVEMAQACITALETPTTVDILSVPNILINRNCSTGSNNEIIIEDVNERSPSPILTPTTSQNQPRLNYASAVKNSSGKASSSKEVSEDLITFDMEDKHQKPILINDSPSIGGSSPEY